MQWYLAIGAAVIFFSFSTFLKQMDIEVDELEPAMRFALFVSVILCILVWPAVVFIAASGSDSSKY